MRNTFQLALLLFLLAFCRCQQHEETHSPNAIRFPEDKPFDRLSDYGLFTGELRLLSPTAGLYPYDLNTELFSDYALKERFMFVPHGKKAVFSSDTEIMFPEGSMLVKNFYYPQSEGERQLIETRLLLHQATGWQPATYIWNPEQSEALLKQAGDAQLVNWTDKEGQLRQTHYVIPNANECKNCHGSNNRLLPLGPKPLNLHKEEATGNQLDRLIELGVLEGDVPLEAISRLPVWNQPGSGTLDQRARAYLEVNCASCHSPQGAAASSQLFLEYQQTNFRNLGYCKPPVAAGSGSGGLRYVIVPGNADESILLFRMQSTESKIRMPEIGRTIMHEEGVALIREWINNLEANNCD